MLLERECHVEVVHSLAPHDVRRLLQATEQRKAAIPQVITASAIVEEPDDLVAELAVLEDFIGHHPSKLPGAGNQNSTKSDARNPAALERFAHQFARQIRENNVENKKDRPAPLRNLIRAERSLSVRRVVGADIQGDHHSEHDRDDAADENVEEVVDARSPASQPVQPLQLEGQRDDDRDDRQDVEILAERWLTLRRRDEACLEPEEIREDERRHAQQGVGDDVKGDQQPIVALYHRCAGGAAMVSSITSQISRTNRSRLKRSA